MFQPLKKPEFLVSFGDNVLRVLVPLAVTGQVDPQEFGAVYNLELFLIIGEVRCEGILPRKVVRHYERFRSSHFHFG